MRPIWILSLTLVTLMLTACSPATLASVNTAASIAGTAVDTFAVMRADAIRAKSAEAVTAAEKGDTLAAMRALNEALATVATKSLDELAATRAELARARASCSSSPPSPTAIASSGTSSSSAPPVPPATTATGTP